MQEEQEEQEVPAQEAPQQLEQSLKTRVLARKLLMDRSQVHPRVCSLRRFETG